MPAWKEPHYARAQDFLRVITDIVPAVTASAARVAPVPVMAPAAVPAVIAPPPASVAPPAPGPTAGSVFKKIPWKK
jgi:hypothetical protein